MDRAREGLGVQAQDMATMMEQLEQSQRLARTAQSEADKRIAELKSAEQRAARKLAEAEEIRKTAHAKANEVIEAALREIRLEAARIFDELKKAPADQRALQVGRDQLKQLQEIGQEFADDSCRRSRMQEKPGGR